MFGFFNASDNNNNNNNNNQQTPTIEYVDENSYKNLLQPNSTLVSTSRIPPLEQLNNNGKNPFVTERAVQKAVVKMLGIVRDEIQEAVAQIPPPCTTTQAINTRLTNVEGSINNNVVPRIEMLESKTNLEPRLLSNETALASLQSKVGTVSPNTSLSAEVSSLQTANSSLSSTVGSLTSKIGSTELTKPISDELVLIKSSLGIIGDVPVNTPVLQSINTLQNSVSNLSSQLSIVDMAQNTLQTRIGTHEFANNISLSDKLAQIDAVIASLPYPKIPSLTSFSTTLEFYGDSITAGYGLTNATTQRYSNIVTQTMNKTEANYAVGGDMMQDLISRVYTNHVSGNTSVISIGTNDSIRTPNTTIIDEYLRSLEATILYCCLPSVKGTTTRTGWKLTDTRNVNYVTRSGTWSNAAAYNMGLFSNTTGSYLEATVNGRFVVFDLVTMVGSSMSNHANISITIDGTVIQSMLPIVTKTTNSPNGAVYCSLLYMYDTGSSGNHTLRITVGTKTGAGQDLVIVSYMGAFDKNQETANQVFVCSPLLFDTAVIQEFFSTATLQSTTIAYIRDNQKRICHKLRNEYGLPVYFIDWGELNIALLQNDGLHPLPKGHEYLANRILSVFNNGEFFYDGSSCTIS